MRRPLDWLSAHPFIRHNLIFFIGSTTTAVLNYLYYPVLGRLLGLSDFGAVQALISVFMQLTILFGAANMVVTSIATNVEDPEERNALIFEMEKLALLVMGALVLVALVFLGQIEGFLHLPSPWEICILLAAVLVGVPLTFSLAYLQGRQRFIEVSLGNIIGAASKLVLAVGFILIGGAAFGAIAGLAVAQVIAWAFVASRAARAGFHWPKKITERKINLTVVRPQLPYVGLVLIVTLVTTVLYSSDTLVVKHSFSPVQAGAYAGIAVIARIIFFLTGSISGVMFPAVKLDAPPQENRRILAFSLALQAVLGGGALLVFSLAPRLVVKTLLGTRYLGLAHLLPQLSLALFMISVINLLFYYHLALRRWFVAVIAVSGGIITYSLLILNHHTPDAVVLDLNIGAAIILVILALSALTPVLKSSTVRVYQPQP